VAPDVRVAQQAVTLAQLAPALVEVPVLVLVCVAPPQVGGCPQLVRMQLLRVSIALVQA
jgi:hypothetical protein